jgi:hypothetical protein
MDFSFDCFRRYAGHPVSGSYVADYHLTLGGERQPAFLMLPVRLEPLPGIHDIGPQHILASLQYLGTHVF